MSVVEVGKSWLMSCFISSETGISRSPSSSLGKKYSKVAEQTPITGLNDHRKNKIVSNDEEVGWTPEAWQNRCC